MQTMLLCTVAQKEIGRIVQCVLHFVLMKSLHNFISYPVDYSGGFSLTCSESLDDSTRNANSAAKALNGPVTALDSMGTTDKIALQMCTISCTKDGYLTHVERVDDVLCSHMDRSKHGNENHHRSYDIIICITHWIGTGKKRGKVQIIPLHTYTSSSTNADNSIFNVATKKSRISSFLFLWSILC